MKLGHVEVNVLGIAILMYVSMNLITVGTPCTL